jgi:hypothetical protein
MDSATRRSDQMTLKTDLARMRELETTGGWTRGERLRVFWYRLRLTVQEMNYATRRLSELQHRLP